MKKTITILLMLALIVSLALVSCTPNDVPNDGADTSGNENGDGNDSGDNTDTEGDNSGNTDTEGGSGDNTQGGEDNGDNVTEETKKYKIVDSLTSIPVLPTENAPEYYVYHGYVYKIFYSADEIKSFADNIKADGVEFPRQWMGFDIESEDYVQVWIFEGSMTNAQYATFAEENKSADELEYNYNNYNQPLLYSYLIYRDEQKHGSGLDIALYDPFEGESPLRIAALDLCTESYKIIESATNNSPTSSVFENYAVLPQDFSRELLSIVKSTGKYYDITYDGKVVAIILAAEELSEELIDDLIEGLRIVG